MIKQSGWKLKMEDIKDRGGKRDLLIFVLMKSFTDGIAAAFKVLCIVAVHTVTQCDVLSMLYRIPFLFSCLCILFDLDYFASIILPLGGLL